MEKIVSACASAMIDYGVIDKKQRGIILYGLDLFFSSIISLISLILIGYILNIEAQTICFLGIFIPLQSFGGGYHCKTHFRCWLLMLVCYLISMYVVMCLPMFLLCSASILVSYAFLKLAPVENVKAPFSDAFRIKMHAIVVCVYFVALLCAIVLLRYNLIFSRTILAAVILSGTSILAVRIRRYRFKVF